MKPPSRPDDAHGATHRRPATQCATHPTDLFSAVFGDRRGRGRLDPDNIATESLSQILSECPTLILVDLSGVAMIDDARYRVHEFLRTTIALGRDGNAELTITGHDDGGGDLRLYQLYSSKNPEQSVTMQKLKEGRIGGRGDGTGDALSWACDNVPPGTRIILLAASTPISKKNLSFALGQAANKGQPVHCLSHGSGSDHEEYTKLFGWQRCTHASSSLLSGFHSALTQC